MKKKVTLLILAGLLVLAMGTSAFAARSTNYNVNVAAGGTYTVSTSLDAGGFVPLSMKDKNTAAWYDTFNGSVAYQSWVTSGGAQASYKHSGFTGYTGTATIYSAYQDAAKTFKFVVKSTGGNTGEYFHATGTASISNITAK